MPRDGNSVYSAPPGTSGIPQATIESAKYNSFVADIVQEQNSARPVSAGGTGSSNPDVVAKNLGLISAKDLAGVNTVGGTADVITLTTARGYTALVDTVMVAFKAASDSIGGGTTLNLDSRGAMPVKKIAALGPVDINVGDWLQGQLVTVRYDTAAASFIIVGGAGSEGEMQVGDWFYTSRVLSSDWLRMDGSLYDKDDYPELAALMPELEDGLVFQTATTGTSNGLFGVTQGEGKYVAVGAQGWIGVSTDRLNWSPKSSGTADGLFSVSHGGGIFVATTSGGNVIYSPDAETWTQNTLSSVYSIIRKVAYDGTNFVLVGQTLSAQPRSSRSSDGASWTTVTPPGSNLYLSVAANASVVVIVGDGGAIATSADHGATWTARTSGTTQSLKGICWDATNNIFVAVGANGTILTSTNGIAWSSRTSGTTGTFNSVGANAQGLVAVGDGGLVRISANGITWATLISGIGSALTDIIGDAVTAYHYVITGSSNGFISDATRTQPTQFRVPLDAKPDAGWIRAVS